MLLVSDGPASAFTRGVWEAAALPGLLIELDDGPHNDWGAVARTRASAIVGGTHVLYLDDDDCYVPGAVELIRRTIAANPEAMLIFQTRWLNGRVIWKHPFLLIGQVSTCQFCYPAVARPGEWGPHYEGDYQFIRETIERNTDRPLVWIPEVICLFRREAGAAAGSRNDQLPVDRQTVPDRAAVAGELPAQRPPCDAPRLRRRRRPTRWGHDRRRGRDPAPGIALPPHSDDASAGQLQCLLGLLPLQTPVGTGRLVERSGRDLPASLRLRHALCVPVRDGLRAMEADVVRDQGPDWE